MHERPFIHNRKQTSHGIILQKRLKLFSLGNTKQISKLWTRFSLVGRAMKRRRDWSHNSRPRFLQKRDKSTCSTISSRSNENKLGKNHTRDEKNSCQATYSSKYNHGVEIQAFKLEWFETFSVYSILSWIKTKSISLTF